MYDLLKKKNYIQFIKFAIVGVSNTLISYLFYLLAISLGVNYVVANIIGYITGTINAFIWNNRWVFRADKDEIRNIFVTFIKMLISYAGTGIVLNNVLLIIFVKFIGISKIVAPLINAAITMIINFLMNKFWVFNNNSNIKVDRSNEG